MPKQNQKSGPKPTVRTSILTKAVRQYTLFVMCMVALLSVLSISLARSFVQNRVNAQLSSLASAKEDYIEHVLQSDRERTALLGSSIEVEQIARGIGGNASLSDLLSRMREEHVPVLGIAVQQNSRTTAAAGIQLDVVDSLGTTTIVPLIGEDGWEGHTVYSPIHAGGVLAVRYDARALVERVTTTSSLAESAEVLLAQNDSGQVVLLQFASNINGGRPLIIGALDEYYGYDSVLAKALHGEEGVSRASDYTGTDVFAAYRTLPTLGWALVVKVDQADVYNDIDLLTTLLAVMSVVLVIGAGTVAYRMAWSLVIPIVGLSKRMEHLGPGSWGFRRMVKTGDEVEVLEGVVADLAKRLSGLYEHLEEEVETRTEELKVQYLKDRAIIESIGYGVIVVDKGCKVTACNLLGREMMGWKDATLDGLDVCTTIPVQQRGDVMKKTKHPIAQAIRSMQTFRSEQSMHLNLVKKDGSLLPVSLMVTPLMSGRKKIGAVAVFQDMTEERRVDYIKSEFISLASHQLRTPISALGWYVELFTGEGNANLTEVQKESVEEMRKAATRMTNLVDSLLHAARIQGGKIDAQEKVIDLSTNIREMCEELRSLAKDKGIACKIDVPKTVIKTVSDPILLHIVVQNLFSNAVKYSKKRSEIRVSLTYKRGQAELTISDQGIGIPKADQKRIFERLFRASNVLTVDTDGNGLGLFISKMIVDILGGDISFTSTENKGTSFTVRIPITKKGTTKRATKK